MAALALLRQAQGDSRPRINADYLQLTFGAMPTILKLNEHDATIGVWHITEGDEELLGQLQLNDAEREYVETLKHSRRYRHWLSSRVMLRQMLNTERFIELVSDDRRKPTLKNFPHNVSFSHSHDMAAVIISEAYEVGIDIELVDPKVQRVRHKFLSADELGMIDPKEEVQQLITCWCVKEALFKFYGKGQVDFIEDLHIHLPLLPTGLVAAEISKEEHTMHHVHTMQLEDYVLAFVVGEVNVL